jgi:hypothetical protein
VNRIQLVYLHGSAAFLVLLNFVRSVDFPIRLDFLGVSSAVSVRGVTIGSAEGESAAPSSAARLVLPRTDGKLSPKEG